MNQKEYKKLLKELSISLDDWVITYAPEFCGEKQIIETRKRIKSHGGTLYYISSLNQKIKKELGE